MLYFINSFAFINVNDNEFIDHCSGVIQTSAVPPPLCKADSAKQQGCLHHRFVTKVINFIKQC